MDILLYLLELIKIRKEIGINGLGTIYKKKSPGRYDAESHMFMPPSYILAFTRILKEDSNLAQYIVQKRNISLSSANYFINEFAEDIKREIASGKHHELKNLGTFFLEDDEIQFTPAKDTNFGFDFYALPPIDETPKNDLNATEESQREIKQEDELIGNYTSEEHQLEDKQEISEQKENTELEAIIEENKQEEENPGDEIDTDEVYEEIVEVNTQTFLQQTDPNKDQWDFASDSIADLNSSKEEIKIPSTDEITNEISESDFNSNNNSSEVKENTFSAKKEWDFDDKRPVNNDEVTTGFENEIANEEEKKSIPLYLKFSIAILVILVIGAVAYFVNPGIFSAFVKNDNDIDQKIVMPIAGDSTLKPHETLSFADSIVNSAQKAGLQVDSARDTLKVTTEAKPLNAPTYEIVAAAFKTQREVNKYIAAMKKKGIVAKEIPTAPGKLMKKISLATYNNPDSAKKDLEKLKKQLKRPELYIFVNKPR